MASIPVKKSGSADLVVIGGVGYNENFNREGKSTDAFIIETPYGNVHAELKNINSSNCPDSGGKDGVTVVLIPRHFGDVHVPPHKINFKAIIFAAASFSAPVLSINSVGTLKYHPRGSFLIPDDFIDMTCGRDGTFFDDKSVHVDMSDPYCKSVRNVLKKILEEKNISYSEGIYVATQGPRFETKAEIKMYAAFGDVVGMTGVPEVVLAKEAGLCYASLCLVTNPAAGLSDASVLTIDEVTEAVCKSQNLVASILPHLARQLREKEACRCKRSITDGKI